MKVIPSYMRTAKFAKTVRFCENPACGKPMVDVNPNRRFCDACRARRGLGRRV